MKGSVSQPLFSVCLAIGFFARFFSFHPLPTLGFSLSLLLDNFIAYRYFPFYHTKSVRHNSTIELTHLMATLLLLVLLSDPNPFLLLFPERRKQLFFSCSISFFPCFFPSLETNSVNSRWLSRGISWTRRKPSRSRPITQREMGASFLHAA